MTYQLTERNKDVLLAIRQYHAAHGFAPTVRELCELVGVRSTSAMHYILNRLQRAGWIEREPGIARTVRIAQGVHLPRRRAPAQQKQPTTPPAHTSPIRIPPRLPYHGPRGSRG